jgi:hypothetical protein
MRRVAAAGALALVMSGCAYYNALYNAERLFAQAERAEARGSTGEARFAYSQSIEKAAKSLRRSPEGRWSDDALYLIGRAHFALGDSEKAKVALEQIDSGERALAAGALAYLGAAEHRLGNDSAAVQRLDESLRRGGGYGQIAAFAHLWRARARFALQDEERAWADLDAAASLRGPLALEARLEQAARAVALQRAEQLRYAVAGLAATTDGVAADSLRTLLRAAAEFDPALARELLGSVAAAPVMPDIRYAARLAAAEILLAGGDTAGAEAELQTIAGRGEGAPSHRARIHLARLRLAAASDLAELTEVRAILLPSVAHTEARSLMTTMQALLVLLDRARETGQPLALFTAAELARDQLHAPLMARNLFLGYAEVAPASTWTGKALLAALALHADGPEAGAVRARLASLDDPYVAALRGEADPASFTSAEERLNRIVLELRQHALNEGALRDPTVVRAVIELDSLRALAIADSMRVPCGALVDSLGLVGEVGDSVRAACLRRDTVRVDSLLSADTSAGGATPRNAQRDTSGL